MKKTSLLSLLLLAVPILALFSMFLTSHQTLRTGQERTFPIEGFDPRDLLSGHYLTYTINYGIKEICRDLTETQYDAYKYGDHYICLEGSPTLTETKPENCSLFIKGKCNWRGFEAGVEKFYIPEKYATQLEESVMNKKGQIKLVIGNKGNTIIKDLLIEGKPWKTTLQPTS